jgi:GAF domain-containing protein/HAMP domain-containing protein
MRPGQTEAAMSEKDKASLSPQHSLKEPKQGEQSVADISDKQRRVANLKRLTLVLAVASVAATGSYAVLYFQIGAWQLLAYSGTIALLASVCLPLAGWLARREWFAAAGYCITLGLMLAYGAGELLLAGSTLYLAVGGFLLVFLAGSIVLPRKWGSWFIIAGLYAAYVWLVNRFEPWPRYDTAHSLELRTVIVGITLALILAMLWQVARAFRIGTIRTRLLIAFVMIVVLTASITGVTSGVIGTQNSRDRSIRQLESVVILKESEVQRWVRGLQTTLATTLIGDDEIRQTRVMLQASPDTGDYQDAYQKLSGHFLQFVERTGQFEELFLMDTQGRVILSTNVTREGKTLSRQAYFLEGLKGDYVSFPYYSPSLGQASVVVVHPQTDSQGDVLGVLAGRASLATLNEIMREPVGLGETGETYLVGVDHALLTQLRFAAPRETVGITHVHSEGVNAALAQTNGSGVYENYGGQPVIGVYHWLPELQMALLAEQDQAEAFRTTYTVLAINTGVALAALLAAMGASLLITRSIAAPIASLAETATQIAAGDLELTAKVEREDEVGALARAFNSMTGQLRELISSLEQRVADRTRDLERRALQLQAAAEVGRAAAYLRDLDELLFQVTHLISERFGFYHAGIFLLDEAGEYAVLRAANSEGGQQMLTQGHRLKVGEQGIVGHVTDTRQPRIALDVGQDAVHFQNPYLPHTRSEMALPLIVASRLLGVLDIQSTEELAVTQEDLAVLQVLADQVAVAIENARLFVESQEALEAERRAYGEISRETWTKTVRTRPDLGFRSDEHGVTSAGGIWRAEMERALQQGQTVQGDLLLQPDVGPSSSGGNGAGTGAKLPLAVPIKVRGQVVGVLDTYKPDDAGTWTPEEVAFLEEITEHLGTALESARLFEESIEERDRSALLLEMSQHLSADLDFDAVVDTVLSFAPRLGAEAADLYIADVERETYFFKSSLPHRTNLAGDEARDHSALIMEKGLEGWVLRNRQPALVSDTKRDDRWLASPDEEEEDPVRCVISVPLLAGRGRIQGVLSLLHGEPDVFSHEDLTLAMSLATQAAVAFENTSLFQATQAALEETDALYRASRAVTTADSMEDIVRAIVVNLPSPQVDQCFLGVFEAAAGAESDELMVVAAWSRDTDPLYPIGGRLSLAQDLIGEPQATSSTMDRNQPLIASDVASESWFTDTRRTELLAAGVRSWAVLPLIAAGGWIGILSVTASRSGAITDRNLQPYLTLASQVALSIERSNLFKQTQEALEETSMLYRASRAIGSVASIPEVAEVLLNSVAESDFDRGLVLIRQQSDDKLEIVAGWDRDGSTVEVGTVMDVGQVSPSLTIYSNLGQGEDLLNRTDLSGDWRQWMVGGEEAELASVPILFRSRLLGVLLIQGQLTRQLTEDVLQPFVTLAAQAAIAIENRRLFEETRRAAEEEALLNEMLRDMATALDIHAIIQTVQASLAQLTPFDRMSVALVDDELSTVDILYAGGDQPGVELNSLGAGQVFPLQETLVGEAINLKKTIVFDLTDSTLHGLEVEPLRQASIESTIIVPMIYGRDVPGSLNLGYFQREAYTHADVPLLERVAQLLAVAIQNARLFSQLSQRAVQLQTAAEVSQAATSTLDLNQLIPQAVELIRERFDLYYVGVFLVDETGKWAILRAGTGEAGRIQLKQGHQLKVGGESMIGWCMSNTQARISLDVDEEAVHFKNPALPDTRSEIALPLISRGEIIGAITVQSTLPAAFSREDITTLQTMADQLANAIQNARFFEQTQAALAETEALYQAGAGLTTAQSYDDILATLREHTVLGQKAQNVSLNLFDRPWTSDQTPEWINVLARWGQISTEAGSLRYSLATFPSAAQLLHSDTPTLIEDVASDPRLDDEARSLYLERLGAESAIFVPLVVGGQWIGYINATYRYLTSFPEPETRRLMAISGQAAVAVQNLRQLQQIQARARREALIREITGKIRGSIDLDTILQTTLTEVTKALGTSHGAIRLGTEESLKADGDQKSSSSTASPLLPSSPDGDLAERGRGSQRSAASRGGEADVPPDQRQQVPTSQPGVAGEGDQE